MDGRNAGTGYLVRPEVLPAPGVLVLHPWWGLTDDIREVCDRLADAGLQKGFVTARMYRGTPPAIDTAGLFAVTTLELG